jgi:hypothetical protein
LGIVGQRFSTAQPSSRHPSGQPSTGAASALSIFAGAAGDFSLSLGFAESCAGAASTIAISPSTISESRGWRVSAENSRRKSGGVLEPSASNESNSVGGSGVCPTTVEAASSRTATPRKGRGMRTINNLLMWTCKRSERHIRAGTYGPAIEQHRITSFFSACRPIFPNPELFPQRTSLGEAAPLSAQKVLLD